MYSDLHVPVQMLHFWLQEHTAAASCGHPLENGDICVCVQSKEGGFPPYYNTPKGIMVADVGSFGET